MDAGLIEFMNCRETSRRLAGATSGESVLARLLLPLHLAYCRHCRRYRRELALLSAAARLRTRRLVETRRAVLEERLIARLSSV